MRLTAIALASGKNACCPFFHIPLCSDSTPRLRAKPQILTDKVSQRGNIPHYTDRDYAVKGVVPVLFSPAISVQILKEKTPHTGLFQICRFADKTSALLTLCFFMVQNPWDIWNAKTLCPKCADSFAFYYCADTVRVNEML